MIEGKITEKAYLQHQQTCLVKLAKYKLFMQMVNYKFAPLHILHIRDIVLQQKKDGLHML
jgi:hypothetical protein